MRKLYLQIYLGFVLIAVAFFVVSSVAWWWHMAPERHAPPPRSLAAVAELIGDTLPSADAAEGVLDAALRERAERFSLSLTVWSPEGERLASVGPDLPAPRIDASGPTWIRHRVGPPALAVRLEDGRWLGLAIGQHRDHRPLGALAAFGLLALVMAAGAYPISRRITRRLERLEIAVDRLGAGDLSARVPEEGRDEVSDLARSFNRSADRIQELVEAQRRVLASASHELRSPLARLRLAVELMGAESRPELRAEAENDIAELDALIEDLLLAVRLESLGRPGPAESVDLRVVLDEEAKRVGALGSGHGVIVGDPRLLRRLIRNLLDNARRYGGGSEIEARVAPLEEGGVSLTVADHGPGVSEADRERIFEPFYRPAGHSEGRDGGVGLGLALVREIARHHGGEARCVPRPGGGTLFEVDLLGTDPEI